MHLRMVSSRNPNGGLFFASLNIYFSPYRAFENHPSLCKENMMCYRFPLLSTSQYNNRNDYYCTTITPAVAQFKPIQEQPVYALTWFRWIMLCFTRNVYWPSIVTRTVVRQQNHFSAFLHHPERLRAALAVNIVSSNFSNPGICEDQSTVNPGGRYYLPGISISKLSDIYINISCCVLLRYTLHCVLMLLTDNHWKHFKRLTIG